MKNKFLMFFLCVASTSALAVCDTTVAKTTPSSDFTTLNDGTVKHNKTGLMWKICSEGQTYNNQSCSGTASKYIAKNALQTSITNNQNSGFANHTDWRVPNVKELNTLVEYSCMLNTSDSTDNQPAINTSIFPNTPYGFYWSSTKISDRETAGFWALSSATGGSTDNDSLQAQQNYVRLVRNIND